MNKDKGRFEHLKNNLERITSENSIFNYESGRKDFLSLGHGNIDEWLEPLLPNTRLIVEPKIIGYIIGIQYINGKLNKAINEKGEDITEKIKFLKSIPKRHQITKQIEIQGVLYDNKNTINKIKTTESLDIKKAQTEMKWPKFCAFQIFHCKLNQFQALQALKNLNFEIPETQFTNFISDIEIYRQCWRERQLFKNYPTSGIVLKINSRKFQKYLEQNNESRHWAYAIN